MKADFPDTWPLFVQAVIEITIDAYSAMLQARIAQPDWDEDTLTINLVDYIRPLARHHPLNLQVQPQVPIYTAAMKLGKVSHKKASKIDIQLWAGHWEHYDRTYFAWECKLIVDKPANRSQNRLIPEYIAKGIARFIDGKYSGNVAEAGMLGYVLSGTGQTVANAINNALLTSPHRCESWKPGSAGLSATRHQHTFSHTDRLIQSSPVHSFVELFVSVHDRLISADKIRLHHAFLTFNTFNS